LPLMEQSQTHFLSDRSPNRHRDQRSGLPAQLKPALLMCGPKAPVEQRNQHPSLSNIASTGGIFL